MTTPHVYENQHCATWLPTLFGELGKLGSESLLIASQNQMHLHSMTVYCPERLQWDRLSGQFRKRGFKHIWATVFIVLLDQVSAPKDWYSFKCKNFWSICFKTKLGHTVSILIDKLPVKCLDRRDWNQASLSSDKDILNGPCLWFLQGRNDWVNECHLVLFLVDAGIPVDLYFTFMFAGQQKRMVLEPLRGKGDYVGRAGHATS